MGATLGRTFQCLSGGLLQAPSDLELPAAYFQEKSLRKHGPADSTPSLRSQVIYILSLWEEDYFV